MGQALALTGYLTPAELAGIQPSPLVRQDMRQTNRAGVERFVQGFLRAAGLPEDLPIITGAIEPPQSSPAVMASNGYYLDYVELYEQQRGD